MIHHSCDLCKRLIDSEQDVRYVVKMEVYAAFDPAGVETEDDRDHLQEIQEMFHAGRGRRRSSREDEVYQQLRFDLCPECRKKFVKNPLGREARNNSISARTDFAGPSFSFDDPEARSQLTTSRWDPLSGMVWPTR